MSAAVKKEDVGVLRVLAQRAAAKPASLPKGAKAADGDGDDLDDDFVQAVAGVRAAKTDREAAHAMRHAIDLANRKKG